VVSSTEGEEKADDERYVDGICLGHKDLGEKTMLFLIDGLYGNENADPPPGHKWKMAPFNDAWPSSIFMSLDGVAVDSVGFDFLTSEWPDLAAADTVPFGIVERRLGVFEHWNNATEKKYSGNLGKANGIELFKVG